MLFVGIVDVKVPVWIEGSAVYGNVFELDVADGPVLVVVLYETAGQFGLVTGEGDVAEGDAGDGVARSTVVLGAEIDLEIEEPATLHVLYPDVVEGDVLEGVFVATTHAQDAVTVCIQYVAVADMYVFQGFTVLATVVAMTAEVEGVCHVGP